MRKKSIVPILALLVLSACGGKEETTSNSENSLGQSSSTSQSSSVSQEVSDSLSFSDSESVETSATEPVTLSEQALASLQGQLGFAYSQEKMQVAINFGEEIVRIKIIYDGQESDKAYFNKDGLPVSYFLTINNQIQEIQSSDFLSWDQCHNPFDNLVVSDFSFVDDAFVLNESKVAKASMFVLPFEEEIESLKLIVQDDEVESIAVATATNQYQYEVALKGNEIVFPEKPVTCVKEAAHDTLKVAFEELKEQSFTVSYLIKKDGDDQDLNYEYKYGDDAFFADVNYDDAVPFGVASVEDKLYKYTYVNEELVRGELLKKEYRDYVPVYGEDFALELLESKGEGVFEAYDLMLENESLVSAVAKLLAKDDKAIEYAKSAKNLAVKLDADNHLKTIEFDYEISGGESGKVTIEFSNLNSTVIDFDFSLLKSLEEADNPGDWNDNSASENF